MYSRNERGSFPDRFRDPENKLFFEPDPTVHWTVRGGYWTVPKGRQRSGHVNLRSNGVTPVAFWCPPKWGGLNDPRGRIRWFRKIPGDFLKIWENRPTMPFWASETARIGLAPTWSYPKDRKSAYMGHSRAIS